MQSFALEIESTADVTDDFRLGIDGLKLGNLSMQIVELLFTRDSGIAHNCRWLLPCDKGIAVKQSPS